MDKKWIISIIIVVILGLALGISLAIFAENMRKTDNTNVLSQKELATSYNEIDSNIQQSNVLETANVENKISPNAVIVKKIYYKACDHLIREVEDIDDDLVNKQEDDVKAKYSDWELESFSPNQITLYKTSNGNCGEHYFVQEHNGVIGIYTTDEYGVKTLKEDTEIATQYLPEADIDKLKAGVEIIGKTKLIEFLEDFE
jgi:hypothetical protein